MGGALPTDVVNQSLDAIGWPQVLGDIEDGSQAAAILLRAYDECLKQLLRAANWDFARKQVPLQLLGDATGNTPDVGTLVQEPWIYCYAYPPDCAKVRFVPQNYANPANTTPAGNISIPSTPQTTGAAAVPFIGRQLQPARFVVASDVNYPPLPGQQFWEIQGVSPQGRTVINTNVKNAMVVYTAQMKYPNVWDPLFRAAFVAYLAAEAAIPMWAKIDRKFGLEMRNQQIPIVKAKVLEARLVDGNEGMYSGDLSVDWMQTRQTGGTWAGPAWGSGGWGVGGPGVLGYGWDSLVLGGTSF